MKILGKLPQMSSVTRAGFLLLTSKQLGLTPVDYHSFFRRWKINLHGTKLNSGYCLRSKEKFDVFD